MLYSLSSDELAELKNLRVLYVRKLENLMAKCVVCEKPTSGSLEFCQKCYNSNKDDIKDKKPWTRVLKNDAQRERRRRDREFEDVSLDQIMDAFTQRGQ
jgi:hypothetical protein